MSSKRKFSDFDGDAFGQSNKKQSQNREFNPRYNPAKDKSKNLHKDTAKAGSINWLKKRVRTIERRFKTGQDLPANVQNDMERELAHHKQKIEEVGEEKHRKSMISKYHMVRFFERKKADRLAKQIRKQLGNATDEEEIRKLKADLHTAEIDSIYSRYFPYREPYVSLYPVSSSSARGGEKSEDASSAAKTLRSERPAMWRCIEEAARQGQKALIEIRERKPARNENDKKAHESSSGDSFATSPNQTKKGSKPALGSAGVRTSKATTRQTQASRNMPEPSSLNNDDDSDGGFFEDG